MKTALTRYFLMVGILLLSLAYGGSEGYPNDHLLVEPAWLEGHLSDDAMLVIDMRSPEEYAVEHIPGAVNLPVERIVAAVDGVPFEFEASEVEAALREAGLERDQAVVIYDDLGMMNSARLFWTLEYVGHEDVRVLHGGWNAWVAEGLPVQSGDTATEPSGYELELQPERIVAAEEIFERLDDRGMLIVDARSRPEYTGELALAERGGRIPGAVHLPWFDSLTGGDTAPTTSSDWQEELRDPDVERFKAPDELSAWLEEKGLDRNGEVVTYCQTLWRGAHAYFLLRLMGFENVRGYDGSWAEWGNRSDLPVEWGEAELD